MPFGTGLGLGLDSVGGAAAFTPASRGAALKGWWASGPSMQNSAGLITSWQDTSGNGNHLAIGATAPAYTASSAAYGNKPVITCSGTQNALTAAGFSLAQPDTIYVVGNISATGSTFTYVDGSSSRQFMGTLGTTNYDIWAGTLLASGVVVGTVTPRAMAGVFNGASSVVCVDSSASPTAGAAGAQTLTGLDVCNGPSGPMVGRIAEIVIVSGADSQSQIAQMFAYFATKFGGSWS